ncbi:MAG: hypothetical protein AAF843_08725 [Bacteroidota bacterium]
MKSISYLFLLLALFSGCSGDDETKNNLREFKMGFTTWGYDATLEAVNGTYSFIENNADIYAEHIDNRIPWNAWVNDLELPVEFTNEINGRADRKIPDKELLLSVSLLNSSRDELAADFDGEVPAYTNLNDTEIEEAYSKHINYLVNALNPDYLVIAIEVNELRLRSPQKWASYQSLISQVTSSVRQRHPDLRISESVSLHNLLRPDVSDSAAYVAEIINHINQMDFVSISFYPFLKNLNTQSQFQQALNFLHANVIPPIAFVETAHLAENLVIPNLNVSIEVSENEQQVYLQTLLENASIQDYKFIIWWAHRDYDALWETFPEEIKDIGQIWRDTGLLNENGLERAAFALWSKSLQNRIMQAN